MTENRRRLRAFLCHSSQDKPIIRELYLRILAAPQGDYKGWIDPWLDEGEPLSGYYWEMETEKEVLIGGS